MDDLNSSMAETYDRENRGVPRLFAAHIARLSSPVDSHSIIHDNACGPVVVTSELYSTLRKKPSIFNLQATDHSQPMITASEVVINGHGWKHVTATLMDSKRLTFDDDTFSHSFTNFLVPVQPEAVREIYRTLKPGGVAIYTTWKSHGFTDLMRRCTSIIFQDITPAAKAETSWIDEDAVQRQFKLAGFHNDHVEVRTHREVLPFEDTHDLLGIVKGPFGRFFTRDWTNEQVDQLPDAVEQVLTSEERQTKCLAMIAWVVIAKKT